MVSEKDAAIGICSQQSLPSIEDSHLANTRMISKTMYGDLSIEDAKRIKLDLKMGQKKFMNCDAKPPSVEVM